MLPGMYQSTGGISMHAHSGNGKGFHEIIPTGGECQGNGFLPRTKEKTARRGTLQNDQSYASRFHYDHNNGTVTIGYHSSERRTGQFISIIVKYNAGMRNASE